VATVPLERNALSGDEELLEVPGDVVATHRGPHDELRVAHEGVAALGVAGGGQGALQHLEERVRPLAVHFDLLEHVGEGFEASAGPDVAEGVEHLSSVGVFLMTELVGRKTCDAKTTLELLEQSVHLLEVPSGCAS